VFFIGGLEVEIKNMVKRFELKTLYQAYNLARLQVKPSTTNTSINPSQRTPTSLQVLSTNKNSPFPKISLKPQFFTITTLQN
jgi:hypothetical protein